MTFDEWKKLSDSERNTICDKWNVYIGEGEEIVKQVISTFSKEYSFPQFQVLPKPAVYHGGIWIIDVLVPFFVPHDFKPFPPRYLGVFLHCRLNTKSVPTELRVGNPDPYEPVRLRKYIENNLEQVRKEIGNSEMTVDELVNWITS